MSSHTQCILSFLLLVNLQLAAVSGLSCYCDICPEKNHTCVTNGYCFASASLQKETGVIKHAYRCLDKVYPPDISIMCRSTNSLDGVFVIECCNGANMCNKNLKPMLHPGEDTVSSKSVESGLMSPGQLALLVAGFGLFALLCLMLGLGYSLYRRRRRQPASYQPRDKVELTELLDSLPTRGASGELRIPIAALKT